MVVIFPNKLSASPESLKSPIKLVTGVVNMFLARWIAEPFRDSPQTALAIIQMLPQRRVLFSVLLLLTTNPSPNVNGRAIMHQGAVVHC